MIDEELKKIWQGASDEAQIQFNKSKLLIEMEQKIQRFDEKIKRRNNLEIIGTILLIPVFTAIAFHTHYPVSKAGAILVVCFGIFVIFKLLHTRKKKKNIDYTNSLKQQLIATKTYIEHEKKLLNTVLYWYILPPFVGCILFWAGMPMNPWKLFGLITFALLLSCFIWFVNKRAVTRDVNPLIEQIETTLKELQS